MAYTELMQTADGRAFYNIKVSRGRGKSRLSKRWYVPQGWSQKAIQRELAKVAAEFERQAQDGEVVSRKEAKQIIEQAEAEQAKIKTLKEYGDHVFLPAKSTNGVLATSTIDFYSNNLTKHIYPVLGNLKLCDIAPAELSAFLLKKQGQGLSHSSVRGLYITLNQLFGMAYHDDSIKINPMDKVTKPKVGNAEGKDTEIAAFDVSEISYICQCLDKDVADAEKYKDTEDTSYLYLRPLQWRAYIRLLIDCGCRKGEALGLHWADVDFQEGAIRIVRSLNYSETRGVYEGLPKNGKSRIAYLGDDTLALLKELKEEHKKNRKIVDISEKSQNYVFVGDDLTTPLFPQAPTRFCKRFGDRYGIKGFHPHKLRHSFASIAITNGADVASVSETLGHSDKAVTLRMYTHADAEAQKRAGNIYRNALKRAMGEITKNA